MGDLGLVAQELIEALMTGNARLDGAFCKAMSNKDVEGAMRCFLDAPDLVVVLYGNVLHGPAALRQFLRTSSPASRLFTARSMRSNTGPLEKRFSGCWKGHVQLRSPGWL